MQPPSFLQRLIGFVLALALGILAFTWTSGATADIPAQLAVETPAPTPVPGQPPLVPTVQAGAPVTVDGNQVTIPGSYLPADYEAPGFRFSPGNLAPAERPAPKDGS
jgi:hypothetical protein